MATKAVLGLAAALALGAAAGEAVAQKSKDTLRFPLSREISTIDPYMETGSVNRFMAENVHDALLAYDERANRLAPLLAKSWRQIDERTFEFDLVEDIVWHDGAKFTADDVAYFLGWVSDPQSRLVFAATWSWIKSVEKLGPYKVRLTAEKPAPNLLARLAFDTWIYPRHIHQPLADKKDYGRGALVPIGTGPYKFTQFDRDRGLRLQRNVAFKHGGEAKPPGTIGNVLIKHVPDVRTQIAGMLVDEWDILTDAGIDQANDLAKDPRFRLTTAATMGIWFAALDANGVSGSAVLTDARVRKAFFKGVNRDELRQLYRGGAEVAFETRNLCFRFMAGCDFDDSLIAYDTEGAKKILADAGYTSPIDVELITANGAAPEMLATAMSGQLRRVGINLKPNPQSFGLYLKAEREAKNTVRLTIHSPRIPDVLGTTNYFFTQDAGRNRNFVDDHAADLARRINETLDEGARKALMKQLTDYNAEQALILPLVSTQVSFVHTKDLGVKPGGRYEIFGFFLNDLFWK
jgi:peptide/nickel transport system substrate-binding protein